MICQNILETKKFNNLIVLLLKICKPFLFSRFKIEANIRDIIKIVSRVDKQHVGFVE